MSLHVYIPPFYGKGNILHNRHKVAESLKSFFRNNDVFNNWDDRIEEVAFAVYSSGQMVAHILFEGIGTDSMNWFTESRIISSSWTDIKDYSKNYFSIGGDTNTVNGPIARRFFINSVYNSCPSDRGWFMVVDQREDPCPMFQKSNYPTFFYSKNNLIATWGDPTTIEEADVMAFFVKYKGKKINIQFAIFL